MSSSVNIWVSGAAFVGKGGGWVSGTRYFEKCECVSHGWICLAGR